MTVYQDRLITLVKANPDSVPEKLGEMIASARGHAGAVARKEHAAAPPPEPAELISFGEFFRNRRLFVEQNGGIKLDGNGLTEWLQIMPGPGKWAHPKYGSMAITPETLSHYVDNFNNKVYQEHIPVDAEHKTKLSGALAYYREMQVGGPKAEPGVWAKLELTERGKELLSKGGFKYFSPEMYDEWEDPATEKVYEDVITGGAFTTRPFFKESSLQPIAASELTLLHGDGYGAEDTDYNEGAEDADDLSDCIIDMVNDGLTDEEISAGVKAAVAFARSMKSAYDRVTPAIPAPMGMMNEATPAGTSAVSTKKTEESKVTENTNPVVDPAKFSEMESQAKTLAEQLETERTQSKQLMERLATVEDRDQTRRFTEVVTGKGGANDGGQHFFGEMETHVSMLKKLAKAFGEESEEVTGYITQQKAVAEAIAASTAMSQTGKTDPTKATGSTVEEGVMADVKAYAETNKIDLSKATAEFFAANPQRYAEYDREFKAKAKNA